MSIYNPYRKYCDLWWRYWLNLPGDVCRFIKRIYDYAPLLWEDADFDYVYLLKLMQFKIKRMRPVIENGIHAHALDVTKQIIEAELLLRNVIEDDPDDEWMQHYDQYHIKPVEFKDDGNGLFTMDDGCEDRECCATASRLSRERDERNWKALWAHLEKYMKGWWD